MSQPFKISNLYGITLLGFNLGGWHFSLNVALFPELARAVLALHHSADLECL
jgi:hypothetical protein